MKSTIFFGFAQAILFCLFSNTMQARVWRVNNNSGTSADYTGFDACWQNAAFMAGDTIYLEGSATAYSNSTTINKRMVVIGAGYLLQGSTGNAGLQAGNLGTTFSGSLRWDSLATGSRFMGLSITSAIWFDPQADSIVFERCQFGSWSWSTTGTIHNRIRGVKINKCMFSSTSIPSTHYYEDLEVTNCIITSSFTLQAANILSALVRNNLFLSSITISNTYFTNNISIGITVASFLANNSIVRHNISQIANVFPAGDGNKGGFNINAIVVNTGSDDGRYRLAVGSPAIGAGETVNGITPDCGPFGTADPYRLSGIPAIPSIYGLSVPSQVPTGTTSINVTISTRANN